MRTLFTVCLALVSMGFVASARADYHRTSEVVARFCWSSGDCKHLPVDARGSPTKAIPMVYESVARYDAANGVCYVDANPKPANLVGRIAGALLNVRAPRLFYKGKRVEGSPLDTLDPDYLIFNCTRR